MIRNLFILFCLALAVAFTSTNAQATLVFQFGTVITGTTPAGTPPWATLTIQNGSTDTVDFTLTHNSSSAAGQFIGRLWLNMDPFPSDAAIVESSPKIVGATFDENNITDAGRIFDILIEFETSNMGGGVFRLKPGESESWQITGTGLTESAFNTLSGAKGENSQELAMLHMQGLANGQSGKLGVVPEPASLVGLLLAGGIFAARRKKS